jgi:hypothetical protein
LGARETRKGRAARRGASPPVPVGVCQKLASLWFSFRFTSPFTAE